MKIPILNSVRCWLGAIAVVILIAPVAGAVLGEPRFDRAAAVASELAQGRGRNVLVVAHRADWREHPENSLPAVRSAVAMGVDIVEIDVRRTKDGRFVIIHDLTLDRTTTGRGAVADFTLQELRALRLVDANGAVTAEIIPTLEEVLAATAGRAVINLDKSFDHLAEIFAVVEREDALGHTLFSVNEPIEQYEARFPGLLARMKFMLVTSAKTPRYAEIIAGYLAKHPPMVLQMTFEREDSPILDWVPKAEAAGVRVWMNSLWSHQNGGHHDDRALTDPDGSFGWIVAQGATIIQTDRPRLLLHYLQERGLRR